MSLDWLSQGIENLEARNLRRPRRRVRSLGGGRCELDGEQYVDFGSNDYLGLAHHAELIEAATTTLAEAGVGARASALVNGRSTWHADLEKHIADFEGTEAALLFPSGYAANVGVLSALAGPADLICSDRLNHASLIDGCRLSKAKIRLYDHNDLGELADILSNAAARRLFVVSDTIFSMNGTVAPLEQLCDLADATGATLIVDEAHATGVLGKRGLGVCELLDVERRVPVRIGTLSKSVGTLGGFVAGSEQLVDFLWHEARTQFFSTALPPAICAAASAALNIIESGSLCRRDLQSMSTRLKTALRARDIDAQSDDGIPIVPIILGDPDAANRLSERLLKAGLFVPAIRPPSVPPRTSRLRISVTAAHSDADIDRLVEALCGAVCESKEPVL